MLSIRSNSLSLLLLSLLITTGCTGKRIPMEDAKTIKSQEGFIEILGQPASVTKAENGSEEWTYIYSRYNIFKLESTIEEYRYIFDKQGNVLKSELQTIDKKVGILPVRELPEDFEEFR